MLKGLRFLIYTFMDKQLLDALNNLSESLEMIAQALDKKGTSNTTTTNALQSGDFSKQLTEINVSLKSIKSDTTKILEKQNTILEMQKTNDSKKSNVISETGQDPKQENSLKKGVTTILLIAVAVLAIGLAFKIIGNIDFLSVVGLGLAIVLISHAFQKVAEAKITVEQAIVTGKVMVIMSIAIAVSSWILGLVRTITLGQAVTAILISGMFTVLSYGIKKIIEGMGADLATLGKSIMLLPILLPAIALGITLSSWILAFVEPISIYQAFTAILIAGMFTVISFGIKKLISALGADISTLGKAILFLPLILPAIALGIAASSWVLQMVTPIKWEQALTAILIAAMFTVISFGMNKLLNAFKGITVGEAVVVAILLPLLLIAMSYAIVKSSEFLADIKVIKMDQFWTALGISIVFIAFSVALRIMTPMIKDLKLKDVFLIPALFVTLSIAIWLSSKILSKVEPIDSNVLWSIVLFSIAFSISAALLGITAWLLAKIGIDKIVEGGICIVILATVVAISSGILSLGKYNEGSYPKWEWALGVSLSILAFGLIATTFGLIIESGIGAVALGLGALAIPVIALVIAGTSHILALGNYKDGAYPNLGWALGVGLSLTAFGMAMGILGTFILGSLGLGMAALVLGGDAVLLIAQAIVDTSFILAKGNYKDGPTKAWAEGISLALGAFAPVYKMLSSGGIMEVLFGSGPTPEQFSEGIITVSKGIVDAARFFATSKALFEGGPSKDWAEGVGGAISAFAPVYTALSSGGWFSVKVTPEDMKSGILTIVEGIITAADRFGINKSKFDLSNTPSKDWGENVGAALQAFAPIFTYMQENSGWFTSGAEAVDDMVYGINSVAQAIVTVAKRFASVKANIWESYPKGDWVNTVSGTIKGFVELNSSVENVTYASLFKVNNIAGAMVKTARTLWLGSRYFSKTIDPNYISSLSKNVLDYVNLANSITGMGMLSGVKSLIGMDPISQAARGMVKIAGAYDKLATALKKFGGALQSIDGTKVNLIRRLTGNLAVLAALNQNAFEDMMQTLEDKASVFSKLLDVDNEKTKRPSVGDKKEDLVAKKGSPVKYKSKYGDTPQQLDTMIELLKKIDNSTSGVDEYIELRSKSTASADQKSQ
jgi:hypothetical protein